MWIIKRVFYSLIWLGLLLNTSCSLNQKPKESFLIIAIEELGSQQVNCLREERTGVKSGFDQLCTQAVRFSHTFTPSTMSVPAMASLLTGLLPYEHKVRNNGSDFLRAEIETVPEIALQKGYATSFFSSGAPLLRKTGLHQGFAVFDDMINLGFTSLYRNSRTNFQQFLKWMKGIGNEPFFSVIYLSDLMFIKTETLNEFGEARNLSYESQLEELDESLFWLLHELKQLKKLDEINLIVLGLNGPGNLLRKGEFKSTSILSERTQVGMLFKPTQKPRDQSLRWSIDDNVTLADLGWTLKEWVSELPAGVGETAFPRYSLRASVQKAQSPGDAHRWILIENAWSAWQGLGNIRYSLRQQHFVFVNDSPAKTYNSLIDPLELQASTSSSSNLFSDAKLIMQDMKALPFERLETKEMTANLIPECLQNLPNVNPDGPRCDSNLLSSFADWVTKDANPDVSTEQKESSRKLFFRDYGYGFLDWIVNKDNAVYGKPWDVHPKADLLMNAINLSLSTVPMTKYKQILQKQRAILKPEFSSEINNAEPNR